MLMQATKLFDQITALAIIDEPSFELCANLGRMAKSISSKIVDQFSPAAKAAYEAHKKLVALREGTIAHFENAETLSKAKIAQAVEKHPGWRAEGTSFSDIWRAEVVDEKLLPREYMMPDYKKIQGLAFALKDEFRVPGVKVYPRKQINFRS